MKTMINISEMFHDETDVAQKTYTLASATGEVYHVEIDNFVVINALPQIFKAMADNKQYVNIKDLSLEYNGRFYNDLILEISWD
jgi:hypothetical protein